MIVQHNIMAINSHRQLGVNNTNLGKNLEKLSSGYRINKAADDAAGLAISEKMRAQITGLTRASLNAQDGASLIQTAEGALTEVHSMLNRMVELATQSANGTIQAEDRQKVEAETKALLDEIDRISKATNFNGIQLLDGSLADSAQKQINVVGVKVSETAAVAGSYDYNVTGTTLAGGDSFSMTVSLNNGDSFTANFQISEDKKTVKSLDDGTVFTLDTNDGTIEDAEMADMLETQMRKSKLNDSFIIDAATAKAGNTINMTNRKGGTDAPQVTSISIAINDNSAVKFDQEDLITTPGATQTAPSNEVKTIGSGAFTIFTADAASNVTNEDIATFSVDGNNFIIVNSDGLDEAEYKALISQLENRDVNIISIDNANGIEAAELQQIASEINQKTGMAFRIYDTATGTANDATTANSIQVLAPKTGNGLTMQVGDTAADFNKITVSVDDMSSAGLGVANISMASQESASRALDRINAAIEKVSVNRGNLGALQNRLEHTINNLGVTTENMTAAESRIRDVDMAKEMMAFTKNNVLSQAAQAMLAQANQQPQQVLQLLR